METAPEVELVSLKLVPATDATLFQDTWLDRVCNNAGGVWKASILKPVSTRRLDTRLADCMNYLKALKANAAKPGDPRYISLDLKVNALLEEYCQKWGCTPENIYEKWPGLQSVRAFAQVPQQRKPNPQKMVAIIVGGIVGTAVVSAALGLVYAIISHSFTWGAHLIR